MIEGVCPLLNVTDDVDPSILLTKQLCTALVPVDETNETSKPLLDITYDIECASLCADFQEDIEFKFSLGIFQIIERLVGPKESRRIRLGGLAVSSPLNPPSVSHPAIPHNHEGVHSVPQPMEPKDIAWSLAHGYVKLTEAHSTAFIASMGMVPYIFWRSVGWKVLAFTGAAYCSLYLYERLTWTSRAKERALKRQFVEHATDKLNLIISFTSTNCSHQVQQELSGTFKRLCLDVGKVREELEIEANELSKQTEEIQKTQKRAKSLRNKANWLANELQNFTSTFLTKTLNFKDRNGSSNTQL